MILPCLPQDERQRCSGRVNDREAPYQDVNVQVRLGVYERPEELTEREAVFTARTQLDPCIEIPAQDQDGVLGLTQGLLKTSEIIGGVHEQRRTRCARYSPAVTAWGEHMASSTFVIGNGSKLHFIGLFAKQR